MGDGQEEESGKLTDLYAKHTHENDQCLHRDAHTPLATHTCSSWHMWQAGRGTQHRGRGHRGRETVAHMMCRAVNRHMGDTLPRHTQRGQKGGRVRQT